jgi:hypothetical protein
VSAVDVLAVMDRNERDASVTRANRYADGRMSRSETVIAQNDSSQARAAVAELMGLARSIHGELRALEGKKSIPKMTGPVLKMLARDLDAALARCKGEV